MNFFNYVLQNLFSLYGKYFTDKYHISFIKQFNAR